jgi:uncharacterized membrane protein
MRAMNKEKFIVQLRKGLSGLPQDDIEERVAFCNEMIEDRKEEGLSEEEAVLAAGSVEEIVAQTVADVPLVKIAKERVKSNRRMKAWEVILLALGSPVWLSLMIAALAVILALYTCFWSVIISLWAVFGSLVGCVIGGLVAGIVFICMGNVLTGIAVLGAGSVCAGLSIFAFFGCKAITKGILALTKRFVVWLKSCFIKRRERDE